MEGEVLECQKLEAEVEEALQPALRKKTSKLSHLGAIRRLEPLTQKPDAEVVRCVRTNQPPCSETQVYLTFNLLQQTSSDGFTIEKCGGLPSEKHSSCALD